MRGRLKSRESGPELITATEIAAFVYCPEQWRLQYGQGLQAKNQAALDAGTRHHWWKMLAERAAALGISLGRLLVIVAVLLLLWLVWR